MTRVMAFGTFDTLHPGHLHYLREAKRRGDELLVIVARDATVVRVKGRAPVNTELTRLYQVQMVPEVDQAVLGQSNDPHAVIRQFKPQVIALGYDQEAFTQGLAEQFPNIEIVRLNPYQSHRYKSALLRSTPAEASPV